MTQPAFIITIDTEGDNLWQNHHKITTENARFLPRFQALCEKYHFKPVYLTNYEMAMDAGYIEFARDVLSREQGEVGMHLHAWNSPPLTPLTEDDWRYKPYLIEYPATLIREKVIYMTELLEETFQIKMRSHRAGRWAFNEYYASLLLELGYQVDCSVTPRVSWQSSLGDPQGHGGSNYRHFPAHAYFIDPENIARPGHSGLLEVPMSIQYKHGPLLNLLKQGYHQLRGKSRSPSVNWLRPAGHNNLLQMQQVVERSLEQGHDFVEFMLHSSEFMPGGSPTFNTVQDIENLYQTLEQLFSWLAQRTRGLTLSDYYQEKIGANRE